MTRPLAADPPSDVAARLRETARSAPEQVALRWQGTAITYEELEQRVEAAAGALQHLGIEPGDRVALILGNTPAFVEAYFGILRAGAAVVPLNPSLAPNEIAYALRDCGAQVCIVMSAVADRVLSLRDELPALSDVVVTAASEIPEGATATWSRLLDDDHAYREIEREPDDLGAIVYTSGTTGRPKGAMLTRRNLAANQDQSLAGRFKVTQEDTVLLVLPLFHIYALNVGLGACVRVGATMVLVERFDPVGSLRDIERTEVTIILGAPPMYVAWLNTPGTEEFDLSNVRLAVSGAAPLPVPVFNRFRHEFGLSIEEGYGLTEAAPSVTSNAMAPEPRPGSVGLPLPGIELRLVNAQGEDVTQGDPGEVWVRGPNVFQGYWEDPQATAETLTPDGWLRTGDVATRDRDGYLYLVDRLGDLIIVSGFNVYPREVERVLEQHPDIIEAAAVGVPHPYTGETVKAYVVPDADAEITEDELVVFCRGKLARYKCPETVELVESLPTTATGKVRRGELRDKGR